MKEESHFRKCKMTERKKMKENSKFIENKKEMIELKYGINKRKKERNKADFSGEL